MEENVFKSKTQRIKKPLFVLITGLLVIFLANCSVKLVQPYDEKLLNDTDSFYKKAATMLKQGMAISPKMDDERKNINETAKHPAHFSAFESKYDALIVDSDALILLSIAGSQEIDAAGQTIQKSINKMIEESLPAPTLCEELKEGLRQVSLTVMNFVDLKCLIIKWRHEHTDQQLTEGTSILKKANWEGRYKVLSETILTIEKVERFKNKQ